MKSYWIFVSAVLLFFLAAFLIVEGLNLNLLDEPSTLMEARGIGAALAGVGLLVVDVLLPVPSSLVMMTNGALFGIPFGTLLSLAGALGAALVGFAIGRRGGNLLARFVPPRERARADRLLQQWGVLAIIVTRPVPILAETAVVMGGASSLSWTSMILASAAGSLPIALLYAITGSAAASLNNSVLSFGFVILVAGLFWGVGRRAGKASFGGRKAVDQKP